MSETTPLKIRVFGDPVLRRKAKPVRELGDYHRQMLNEMAKLMYANSGIGLAAPQLGIGASMILADIGSGLYKLINPSIFKKEGRQVLEEGCLSVPGVCVKVKRAKKVVVKALNERGEPVTITASDLLAGVLQHEIDHLRGRLIVDYASFFKKLKIKNKLEELRKIGVSTAKGVCKEL